MVIYADYDVSFTSLVNFSLFALIVNPDGSLRSVVFH